MKFAVIGHPIKHSLSPLMHNANFKALNNDNDYVALNIDPKHFHHIKSIIEQENIDGFNVTIPFKQDIMAYCDEIDDYAKQIGAVNTVVIKNGKWIGYNTDAEGYLMDLQEHSQLSNIHHVFIVGAGGASRALATILQQHDKSITIANRTKDRLNDWTIPVEYVALSMLNHINIEKYDLIINTTPNGMSGFNETFAIDLANCKKQAVISDIIYNPKETSLLKQADQLNLTHFNGLGMFVYQGALSFELWTGKKANIDAMKNALIKKLY